MQPRAKGTDAFILPMGMDSIGQKDDHDVPGQIHPEGCSCKAQMADGSRRKKSACAGTFWAGYVKAEAPSFMAGASSRL